MLDSFKRLYGIMRITSVKLINDEDDGFVRRYKINIVAQTVFELVDGVALFLKLVQYSIKRVRCFGHTCLYCFCCLRSDIMSSNAFRYFGSHPCYNGHEGLRNLGKLLLGSVIWNELTKLSNDANEWV